MNGSDIVNRIPHQFSISFDFTFCGDGVNRASQTFNLLSEEHSDAPSDR